ncbi:hypothetical protein IB024_01600 [Brucella sp. 6810]|uniref:hypothetical protein n=1 Tax=Brucella sp. 6810 TaxID=2769351 RepID=UPI00165BD13C|nr:hypothetical protein [Brucella sp. 6810]QNQ62479.1 hypothetical protein IB024_01600 [Brucella sp. 6810]
MASELTLEQKTWHQLECAANSAGGIEVAMVSLPIAQIKALVEGRNTRPAPAATDTGLEAILLPGWPRLCGFAQAEELLAAEKEHTRFWQNEYTKKCKLLLQAEADNAAKDARIKELNTNTDTLMAECHRVSKASGDQFREMRGQIEAIKAKLAAAEKALEPFAAVLEGYDPDWEDDDVTAVLVVGSVTHYGITLGDFRKARAVLEGKP